MWHASGLEIEKISAMSHDDAKNQYGVGAVFGLHAELMGLEE